MEFRVLTTMKTLKQLRTDFEEMASPKHFDIERGKFTGEYKSGSTFCMWAGYWECAVKNKIITGNDADIKNIHSQ